jgi:hypothetical protein
MTEELFKQAREAICGVSDAEYNLEKLSRYTPDIFCAIRIGSTDCGGVTVCMETDLAEQVINFVADYYEKKRAECQQKFDAL